MIIGLTGGIGSGKSTVGDILSQWGIEVIDADEVGKTLQKRGAKGWRKIFESFGWPYITASGDLNRKKLAHCIFSNNERRNVLNAIMHPLIHDEVQQRFESSKKWVVLDSPLLIESGFYRLVDELWVVNSSPEDQRRRIMARDGISNQDADRRMQSQMPTREKVNYATRIINNTGGYDDLRDEVRRIWEEFQKSYGY